MFSSILLIIPIVVATPIRFSSFADVSSSTMKPSLMNKIHIPNVAFASLVIKDDDKSSLFLSAFSGNPFANGDATFMISKASDALNMQSENVEKMNGSVTWPNTITFAPSSVFGNAGVISAGGFLVPGKSDGGIWFSETIDQKQGPWINIFKAKNYFYHDAKFYDVDKDGQLDIITCRATKPLFGAGHGDLTYLQPQDRNNPTGPWVETVLNSHCDTFFQIGDIDGDGIDEIIAAEFWGDQLSVIKTTDPNGKFSDPKMLKVLTVDKTIGHLISLKLVDLNDDGNLDILVTNHQGEKDKPSGAIYAFEIPSKLEDPWTRHTLASGFEVLVKGFKQAAPGIPSTFYPHSSQKGKPSIVLGGDASEKAYILTANSKSPSNWDYTMTVLHDCQSTVGGIAVGDVNGSGYTQIFIPCYESGYLSVYTYGI